MYFYNTNEFAGQQFGSGCTNNLDANVMYGRHFNNSLYLKFFEENETDWRELVQIRKEKEICERKLRYWKNKPDFNIDVASNICNEYKKNWK